MVQLECTSVTYLQKMPSYWSLHRRDLISSSLKQRLIFVPHYTFHCMYMLACPYDSEASSTTSRSDMCDSPGTSVFLKQDPDRLRKELMNKSLASYPNHPGTVKRSTSRSPPGSIRPGHVNDAASQSRFVVFRQAKKV